MGIPCVSADACRRKGAGRLAGDFLWRTSGYYVQVGPGNGEGAAAICFRSDVRNLRIAAGTRAAVDGKRRRDAGSASLRGVVARLLGKPVWAKSKSGWPNVSHGQSNLRDRGCWRKTLYRDR